MRSANWLGRFCLAGIAMAVGCTPGNQTTEMTRDARRGTRSAQSRDRGVRHMYTAADNPTLRAGRGEPTTNDQFRPSAWLLIDGKEGRYIEVDGNPHLEWVIDPSVSSNPTFQLEVFEPLLGAPTEFSCVLQSLDSGGDTPIRYGILAEPGALVAGHPYSLLNPGDGFIIRNLSTKDVVQKIGPLPAGRYTVAAAISNPERGVKTPAVTFFTVEEE